MTSPLVLTAEQERVASLRDGCHLVVAPPGSGKTEVLAQRVVRLLQGGPSDDFNVLALSFTKNAAGSMRQRVSDRLGSVSPRLHCTTYHAFCLDILRHYGHLLGIPPEVTVYDLTDDRIEALKQGLVDEGYLGDPGELEQAVAGKLLDGISRCKRSLVPPDAATEPIDGSPVSLRDAYAAYNLALEHNHAVDFDTVLVETYRLLTEHERVARHYRLIYRFILVDEAQDTSLVQYEILKALCGDTHRNVFMVADPAQSIYGFTGASSRYVDRFVDEFGARRHELTITFRCAQAILSVAAKLFVAGRRSATSPLSKTHSVAQGQVTYEVFKDETDEAVASVEWAESLLRHGLPMRALAPKEDALVLPEHIAILARSRLHLKATLSELDARDVPYHFAAGGESGLFDSDPFRMVLYGLRLLANPRDIATARALWASAVAFGGDESGSVAPDESPSSSKLLPDLVESLRGSVVEVPIAVLSKCLDGAWDVTRGFEELLSWQPDGGDERLAELVSADKELLEQRWTAYKSTVDRKDRTWSGALLQLLDTPRPESPGIRILTVHAAKGLEFRAVSILGMNEGSFPDFRNSHGDGLDSEQRLAYVAATRAARVLRWSRPLYRRTRYGTARVQEESRFIGVAGLSKN